MKKLVSITAVVAVLVAFSGFATAAEHEAAAKAGKGAGGMEEITITGKIAKSDVAGKSAAVSYVLIDADGNKVKLPKVPEAKAGETAINLGDFVDAQVELVGKGKVETKDGKKHTMVKSITSVKKVEAAPADEKKDAAPVKDADPVK